MQMTDPAASQRYAELADFAGQIALLLQSELDKLGFEPSSVGLLSPDEAVYRLERDPYNGEDSLVGEWRDDRGLKFGQLLFHADGSFYVEQDVARLHPRKSKWFVEAVNAWGREGQIKAEARLLPMPD